jgi:endoglycosylceramidase
MQWAQDAGLTVVLDMHQDVYGEGFGFDGAPRWTCDESNYAAFVPNENWILNYADAHLQACYDHFWNDTSLQDQFAAMWGHVAARLADQPAIIGFDPMNEPHWGSLPVPTFEVEKLQPMYARVISAVRTHAPWIVFAEPAATRNLGLASRLEPFDVPDVVYSPHMYDASAELNGTFDEGNRETLMSTAMDLRADADRLGTPLWIGEYGGIATSPLIGPYMDAAYDGAAAALASTMYWAFDRGGGYSVFDADGTPRASLLDAIVRPYPAAVAGTLNTWDYDDTTRTLRVTVTADATVRAPTLIIVPERVYPQGYDVACGGCTVVRSDGELTVVGGNSTVTISPR